VELTNFSTYVVVVPHVLRPNRNTIENRQLAPLRLHSPGPPILLLLNAAAIPQIFNKRRRKCSRKAHLKDQVRVLKIEPSSSPKNRFQNVFPYEGNYLSLLDTLSARRSIVWARNVIPSSAHIRGFSKEEPLISFVCITDYGTSDRQALMESFHRVQVPNPVELNTS